MNFTIASNLIRDIYAIFGKNEPSSKIREIIIEKIEDVPDKAAHFILQKFENMDEFRTNINLSKTINMFSSEFLSQKGNAPKCSHCAGDGGHYVLRKANTACGYVETFAICGNCVGIKVDRQKNTINKYWSLAQLFQDQRAGKLFIVPKNSNPHQHAVKVGLAKKREPFRNKSLGENLNTKTMLDKMYKQNEE